MCKESLTAAYEVVMDTRNILSLHKSKLTCRGSTREFKSILYFKLRGFVVQHN